MLFGVPLVQLDTEDNVLHNGNSLGMDPVLAGQRVTQYYVAPEVRAPQLL